MGEDGDIDQSGSPARRFFDVEGEYDLSAVSD